MIVVICNIQFQFIEFVFDEFFEVRFRVRYAFPLLVILKSANTALTLFIFVVGEVSRS
jgi:hypothetical protein